MIDIEKFTLDNGLKVIVHKDESTPIVAVNIIYNVGSKDEHPDKTGFAHLFEHLMFGGSVNIPNFDEPLENAGGENNAFTNSDFTNYYITLPLQNIETAFWLESDRMLSLAFSKKSLEVQRNVVIEEFKQVNLNQPYGDIWHLLKPLAYKIHPYQWNTIGKSVDHIENASLEDVKEFFFKFYRPNNAILVVVGNVNVDEIKTLTEKWFGNIPAGEVINRNIPQEPAQTEKRTLTVERDIPQDAIYKAYQMCEKSNPAFYAIDLLSDILSNGNSSRLNQILVKEKNIFSEINAYLSGDIDKGLFVFEGKINQGISVEVAEKELIVEIERIKATLIDDIELQKVKNKIEATLTMSEINVLNKAMNLAYFELLGDAKEINFEINKYQAVKAEDIMKQANILFREENCSTLYYLSTQK